MTRIMSRSLADMIAGLLVRGTDRFLIVIQEAQTHPIGGA